MSYSGAAHVPLGRYAANLHSLASQLQQAGVQHLVLATPPPVWEDAPKVTRTGRQINYNLQEASTAMQMVY
jgi:hypothetical protein